MRIVCAFGEHQYGDRARGLSLEAACFIPALREQGHEVRLVDTWSRTSDRSLVEVNRRLLATVDAWRPDLLLSVIMDVEIWAETITAIRRRGVRTVSWAADDTWKWRQVSRFIASDYDGMITTYAGALPAYRELGIASVALSQWAAAEESLREPRAARDCTHQVSFVGMAYGDRRRYIAALSQAGIRVSCFGHNWPAGSIAQEAIAPLMRDSAISLNFSKGLYGGPNQTKARVFEVPGHGGFLLSESSPDLSRWFRIGTEIDVFSDPASLVERVRFYLDRPELRDQCAQAAYRRTRDEHTYRLRMRALMAFAATLPTPASTARDFIAFHKPHHEDRALHLLRRLAVWVCTLLWGERRALAYARRIGFELSWRLSGRSTFTAAGWFGRMFP